MMCSMTTTIKCLSVRQPWAWCLAHGVKPVENRDWRYPPRYRGPLAIHAGQRFDFDGLDWILAALGNVFGWRDPHPKDFNTGGIVGRARLVDCVTEHPSLWFFGPMGLVMEGAVPTIFHPCSGRLGLFDVPAEWVREAMS